MNLPDSCIVFLKFLNRTEGYRVHSGRLLRVTQTHPILDGSILTQISSLFLSGLFSANDTKPAATTKQLSSSFRIQDLRFLLAVCSTLFPSMAISFTYFLHIRSTH